MTFRHNVSNKGGEGLSLTATVVIRLAFARIANSRICGILYIWRTDVQNAILCRGVTSSGNT